MVLFAAGGAWVLSLLLVYIGVFLGIGLGLYLALPDRKRQHGRRVMMVMVGSLLLLTALLSNHGNMQIEGLFFGVLLFAPYIILHYALAKFIGPLFFGRIWCGWACWFAMVFDLLPYRHSRYRIPGKWGLLRYVHFFTLMIAVLVLWFGFGYHEGGIGTSGLGWFIGSLLVYYAVGITMAVVLKDNRAFCKYLCPIAVPLKATSRYAILKVSGVPDYCAHCEACVEMCPMNIRVKDYIMQDKRVLSTECTLCQTCINVCPHNSLQLSFGLDVGGEEFTDWEPPRKRQHRV